MGARVRTLYWVVAVIFLLVTLAEAGFFAEAEGEEDLSYMGPAHRQASPHKISRARGD
jgi:hypothetical protein